MLAIAVALRAIQYLANTSLSLDEAALALNIINRPPSALLDQLDFNQGAPPAFLFLERGAQSLFGKSEYAFRSVSFAAGVIAPVLMIPFARRLLSLRWAVLLALALFAFSESLILFSATGKQYGLDVLATLVIYVAASKVVDVHSLLWTGIWAIIGSAAIWLSFATVFVLAGVGSVLIVRSGLLHRWRSLACHSIAGATWLASFAALYLVSVTDLGHLEQSLQSVTAGETGTSGVLQTLAGAMRSDLGITHLDAGSFDLGRVVAVLAILLAFVGFAGLVRDKPVAAALLAAPVLVTLLASELGKYPLFPRTLLFLTPACIAFVAYGAARLAIASRFLRTIGVAAMTVVFAFIAIPTLKHVAQPQRTSDLKPALRFLAEHQRQGDTLWIYHATQYGLRYYLECKCFGDARLVRRGRLLWPLHPARGGPDQFSPALNSAPPRFIVSRSVGDSTAYQTELNALRGRPRVWILITDASTEFRSTILAFLDRTGTEHTVPFGTTGHSPAAAHLYDLSRGH